MSDRELLELAAKANWAQELEDDEVLLRYSEPDDGILYLHADNQDHNGIDREFRWNPLEEDHDALRLAVKLSLTVETASGQYEFCEVRDEDGKYLAYEQDGDIYAITRRAIVSAAAAIGWAMSDKVPEQSGG